MKETALERQARRDREARERLAMEKAESMARAAEKAPPSRPHSSVICGTEEGYQRHRRARRRVCDMCREAHERTMDEASDSCL